MNILVINAGSSSLKYKLFSLRDLALVSSGTVDCIGPGFGMCTVELDAGPQKISRDISVTNHKQAVQHIVSLLRKCEVIRDIHEIKAIGHRVVHGGEFYTDPVRISKQVLARIRTLADLAPLHNAPNVQGIEACQLIFKNIPQVAVFDTAFHSTISEKVYLYGIPREWYTKYHIRKYGFHGISHEYVAGKVASLLEKKNTKIVSCHLGNGSSVTAIHNGKSIDTSMGFTPLDGLVMGTRSGSIDPSVIFYLMNKKHISANKLEHTLNYKSGLFGVTGIGSDIRVLRKESLKGNAKAKLGLAMFVDRLEKVIGSYVTAMDGMDALVFTAGIGEKAYYLRKDVCDEFDYLGMKIDSVKNKANATVISTPSSSVKVFVIPTNEEVLIAQKTRQVLKLS